MHARGVVEARQQLVEASSASSVISEDGPYTPEAGIPLPTAYCLAMITCMTGGLLSYGEIRVSLGGLEGSTRNMGISW